MMIKERIRIKKKTCQTARCETPQEHVLRGEQQGNRIFGRGSEDTPDTGSAPPVSASQKPLNMRTSQHARKARHREAILRWLLSSRSMF